MSKVNEKVETKVEEKETEIIETTDNAVAEPVEKKTFKDKLKGGWHYVVEHKKSIVKGALLIAGGAAAGFLGSKLLNKKSEDEDQDDYADDHDEEVSETESAEEPVVNDNDFDNTEMNEI